MASPDKARTLVAIDRAISSLHPITVAEILRAAGETALASQIEHHSDESWRSLVLGRLDRMPDERLRAIATMLAPQQVRGSVSERDLERVRSELVGELLGIKQRLVERPMLTEHDPDGVWRGNLPETWDDLGPLIPTIRVARDRLRDVGDDLRAELADNDYPILEVVLVEEVVLRGIARICEALTMAERRSGDWHAHRAVFTQGLYCLTLAISILSRAEIGARLARPTFAAHALACGLFAE